MMSSNVLLFPGRAFDITKFHGHWSSNKEITQGGGGGRNPPAVLDFKKPGLFRVKVLSVDSDEHSSIADHLVNTGHNMKWYHFEIPAGGKTSKHCLIKREPTDRGRTLAYVIGQNYGRKQETQLEFILFRQFSLPLTLCRPPPPPISMLKSWHIHIQTLQEKY